MLRFTRVLAALAVLAAVLVATPAAPAAAAENKELCHHVTWGGTYYCKYGQEVQTLGDTTIYFVVVNVNYQVWTRWRNSAGQFSAWTSLGGQVWRSDIAFLDGNPDDLQSYLLCGNLVIRVTGTDANPWWRMRFSNGQWTNDWSPVAPAPCV